MTRAHYLPGSYVVTVTRPLFGGRGAWGSATHYTVPLPGTFASKTEARSSAAWASWWVNSEWRGQDNAART